MDANGAMPLLVSGDNDLEVVARQLLGELLPPLDERCAVAVAVDKRIVVDVLELVSVLEPIQIEVVQRDPAVYVGKQDVEGGAGDRGVHAKSRSDALNELGLTRAEVARKER